MQFLATNTYEMANAWAVLIAATVGIAVFGLVLRWALTVDLTFGVQFDARAFLARLGHRLEQLRHVLAFARRRLARLRLPARPVAFTVAAPGPQIDPDWELLSGTLETRAGRMRVIGALHERAGNRIDAAEYALDRLLADCAAVALTLNGSTRLQHVRAAIASPAAPAAKATAANAIPGTLAA